jgi:hypothetical protein
VNDHAQWPTRPHLDRGLDIQVLLRDLLASLIHAVLGGISDREHKVALSADRELAANAE